MAIKKIGPVNVYSVNINSLLANNGQRLRVLEERIQENVDRGYSPHVVLVQETKLDSSVSDADLQIDGYTIYRKDRNRHGGGVAIYVRHDVKTMENYYFLPPAEYMPIEAITSKIKVDDALFAMTSTYRPPYSKNLRPYVVGLISHIGSTFSQYNVAGGDFNSCLTEFSNIKRLSRTISKILITVVMFIMGMVPTIRSPTHGPKIIDQIYIPAKAVIEYTHYEEPIEARHRPVFVSFIIYENDDKETTKSYHARKGMLTLAIGIASIQAIFNKWYDRIHLAGGSNLANECIQWVTNMQNELIIKEKIIWQAKIKEKLDWFCKEMKDKIEYKSEVSTKMSTRIKVKKRLKFDHSNKFDEVSSFTKAALVGVVGVKVVRSALKGAQTAGKAATIAGKAATIAGKAGKTAGVIGQAGKVAEVAGMAGAVPKGAVPKALLPVAVAIDGVRMVSAISSGDGKKVVKTGAKIGAEWGVGWVGATIGAEIGTVIFPGVGTLIGGVFGGIVGALGGGAAAEKVADDLMGK